MTVSIVIPVFNRWDMTQRCLFALDTTAPYAEVVVVDNGSSDGTKAGLEKWLRAPILRGDGTVLGTRAELGRGRVLTREANGGFAVGSNEGLRAARGAYVVFLNNDTIPRPGWLEGLCAGLEGDGSVGLVGALLLFPTTQWIQHAGMGADVSKQILHLHPNKDPKKIPGVFRAKDLQAVTGACILMRRELALELGGFDEAYRNSYEDVDLCFRVRQKGLRVRYEPRAVVWHYEGQTEGRLDNDFANRALFFSRWEPFIVPDLDELTAADLER